MNEAGELIFNASNDVSSQINLEIEDSPEGFDENAYIEEVIKTNFLQNYEREA